MATQASYSRSLQEHQAAAMRGKLSIMAQAKPAIISSQEASSAPDCGDTLSEKLRATLRLASAAVIEDDTMLEKQNASNQMRQAAIVAASQQQSKRLSATERLALSAKRPPPASHTNQQLQSTGDLDQSGATRPLLPPPPPPLPFHGHQRSQSQVVVSRTAPGHLSSSSSSSSKLAPMPTLETLLAVQRQLQRHTRQNLTTAIPANQPQDLVKPAGCLEGESKTAGSTETCAQPAQSQAPRSSHQQQFPNLAKLADQGRCHEQQNNPYVTTAACQQPAPQQQQQLATYDKELPPLPESVTPSSYATSSDDSQPNSLESQSSPAASLVSLPPPPPPLSAYLQQYDEVSSCMNSRSPSSSSASSTPPASAAELQHQRQQQQQQQFVQIPPIKRHSPETNANHFAQPAQVGGVCKQAPALAPRPQHLARENGYSQMLSRQQQVASSESMPPPPPPLLLLPAAEPARVAFDEPDCAGFRFPTPPPPELTVFEDEELEQLEKKLAFSSSGAQAAKEATEEEEEEDDDSDDEDDFQCRIPTPPPSHKSVSFASFQDLSLTGAQAHQATLLANQHQQFNFRPPSASEGALNAQQINARYSQQSRGAASAFKAASINFQMPPPPLPPPPAQADTFDVQPPSLFRQANSSMGSQQRAGPSPPPLLTVRVQSSDEEGPTRALPAGGLLSTARQAGAAPAAGQQHVRLTNMSSSPSSSSSSDGDGHSSNSSSSTSGVHSSIDSPLSDGCKQLDEARHSFNYAQAKLASRKLASASGQLAPSNLITGDTGSATLKRKPAAANLKDYLVQQQQQRLPATLGAGGRRNSSSSLNSIASTVTSANGSVTSCGGGAGGGQALDARAKLARMPAKPALKQKKSVHFSDKIEMVACADEQCEAHLPNPLLARVLAAKMQ